MYSIVLAMALSNGAALPAWDEAKERPGAVTHQLNRHRRGHGCCGCTGGGYSGCYGGGYASGGCWGGGYASGGCWGGSYGSYSGSTSYGAYPAYGNQSYYGGTPADMSGLYGPAATPGYYGPGMPGTRDQRPLPGGRPSNAGSGIDRTKPGPDTSDGSDVRPPQEVNAAAPARIIVTLPADARLAIDDNPTRTSSAVRSFVTPPLEAGKTFRYTLKAEVVRDGQVLSQTQRIEVRAGAETRATMQLPSEPVARK